MSLTKAAIVEKVYTAVRFPKNLSIEIVESLLETIKASLESGGDVLVSGFGKFCVKDKKERKGRNPTTGEDVILSARRVVTFKCSTILRDKVNSK
jgi:integration host factor subunit alpha